jgi:hypothetical protein
MAVAVLTKAYVCGSSIVGIAGSTLAEGMDDCLMILLCFVLASAFTMG